MRSDHTPADLVELDALEQRLEIAFAEALVTLALDDLEEDRADHVLGEDLQQQALVLRRCAVEQDVPLLELGGGLAMAFHASVEQLVIGLGRLLKGDATAAQHVDRLVDVAGAKRDVLDALALIFTQELLDLALVVLALVQGDADLAARAGHRLGNEAGELALDVEVADFAETEELLIEFRPHDHAAAVHVVGEMVDVGQTAVELSHAALPV